jgi:MFS family permease
MVFANAIAITFLGMSVEGLMAHATPPDERGRAAGWFQMGNLGGNGLGGGLGLLLAEQVSSAFSFCVIAAVLGACTLGLLFVPEAAPVPEDAEAAAKHEPHWIARIIEVFKEVFGMLRTRRGIVAIALVFLPIGSVAAGGLFSGQIATDWHASADLVALTSGLLAGIISAVGCLVGGFMSDRLGRRNAYMLSGLICAAAAVGFALFPKGPVAFATFSLAYQFAGGIAYGAFTGFVLEVIGKGAAATKYNALASLSNIPITYMTKVDGWASTKYGPMNMLFVDAGSEIAGIVIFVIVLLIVRPDRERLPDEPKVPEAKVVSG